MPATESMENNPPNEINAQKEETTSPFKKVLRSRNFRLLWVGEGISLLGDQFFLIALPWLLLQLCIRGWRRTRHSGHPTGAIHVGWGRTYRPLFSPYDNAYLQSLSNGFSRAADFFGAYRDG